MLNFRKVIYQFMRIYWYIFKPLILGSRAIVVKDNQVLLVRLSYQEGWYLPGGGVDKGESFHEGMKRELREECQIETNDLNLLGLYFTKRQGKIDHVAIFIVKNFSILDTKIHDKEIEEIKFFPIGSLPETTSPATKRRINEYLQGRQVEISW